MGVKRSAVGVDDVAEWENLLGAFYLAAQGKRTRSEVRQFAAGLTQNLSELRDEVLLGQYQPQAMQTFYIRDPKPRLICAPAFRDRVLHHGLMAHVGPVLERALVHDTYACRKGKGTLAAVLRCQKQIGRFQWYAKVDMRAYFASIDHRILKRLLARKFKDGGLLGLVDTIIDAFEVKPGVGLPIGALTSQCFANYYLAGFDRFLLESCKVGAMVRYMDDVIWWGRSKEDVMAVLARAHCYLKDQLALEVKPSIQVNRCELGVPFCGYRVLPGGLRLTRRKKRRYGDKRGYWEQLFKDGDVDAVALQRAYDSILSMVVHGHSTGWRRAQLVRFPSPIEV
jgi:hypothetical protein